jgi:hypothetical protein
MEKYQRWQLASRLPYSIIGVIGSKADARGFMDQVRECITQKLNLQVAEEKSKIIHAKEGTTFLGYRVISLSTNKIRRIKKGGTYSRQRAVAERMTLGIPEDRLLKFCHRVQMEAV